MPNHERWLSDLLTEQEMWLPDLLPLQERWLPELHSPPDDSHYLLARRTQPPSDPVAFENNILQSLLPDV